MFFVRSSDGLLCIDGHTTARTARRRTGIVGVRKLLARIHGIETERATVLPIALIPWETTRR